MLGEVVCPTELALSASYHYSYDRQGNTLSDGENQYRYDSKNRLTEIETQNGDLQKNRYDGEGLRAELEENGELTRFLYSGRDIVAEQDEKNNTVRYVRGLELLSSDSECARTYYHYAGDELGSITHVTDINGTVLNRYAYDAFGNRSVKEEMVQNRFGFTGEICDGLTGQYYLRARFYNPVIGRFLNEDTYYGDGLNLYSYCRNNPVRFVDPSGHWCEGKEGRGDTERGSEAWNKDSFRKNADPFRDVMGSGMDSHPEQWNALLNEMKDNGVEIVYREGAMAYAPAKGLAGQLVVDPNASYSALIHEYTHYLDDVAAGFPGMQYHFQTINRVKMELHAYMQEIKLADSLGYKDVANQLFENYREERALLAGHLK